MRYLFAIVFPPLALLLCGKVFQAMLALLLLPTCVGYFPSAAWALCAVGNYHTERRHRELIRALDRQTQATRERANQPTPAPVIVARPALVPPAPRPVISPPAPKTPRPPRRPTGVVVAEYIAAARAATRWGWRSALEGYGNLPEWCQPIVWGMLAATPISLAIIVVMLLR